MCNSISKWEKCIEFHGHSCPFLAMGYRVGLLAMEKLGFSYSNDEEILCVTENDACCVDAIQVVTGCTIGKGNLIFRDRGKQAFSFFNRKTGEKIRIVFKKKFDWEKVSFEEVQNYILSAPDEELFDFKEPSFEEPEPAKIFVSLNCENCGEMTAERKLRFYEGKKLCLDCCPEYSRGW